jgi:hypothetical protein
MRFLKLLLVLCALLLFTTQALALQILPTTDSPLTGDETSQSVIDGIVKGQTGYDEALYKSDWTTGGGSAESGPLAGSYATTYSSTPSDPSDATITWEGGDIVGPTAYLLVKDGNHTPAWYLFNLTALDWDGKDTLYLSGFWPQGGAISHVSLYGTPVPEPSTMLLLGAGLLGLAGFGKRIRKS